MSTTAHSGIIAALGLDIPVPSESAWRVDANDRDLLFLILQTINARGGAETPGISADKATATAGTATITYAGAAGVRHAISAVYWSYSGSDTLPKGSAPGTLTINDGANVLLSIDITAPGAGFLPFDTPFEGTSGNAMTVVLSSGGASVVGKVNARHYAK